MGNYGEPGKSGVNEYRRIMAQGPAGNAPGFTAWRNFRERPWSYKTGFGMKQQSVKVRPCSA